MLSYQPKPENKCDWYPRPIPEIFFIVALNVFEMMGDDIDQRKLNAFPTPYLSKVSSFLPLSFRDTIY